jgi:hypothetical protein
MVDFLYGGHAPLEMHFPCLVLQCNSLVIVHRKHVSFMIIFLHLSRRKKQSMTVHDCKLYFFLLNQGCTFLRHETVVS